MALKVMALILFATLLMGAKVKKTGSSSDNITTEYVHNWKTFPTITGKRVTGGKLTIKPQKGQALVAVFLASWCLPCQKLINDIKALEKKFSKRHTRFVYIFAADTVADAQGFRKAYNLGKNAMVANVKLMKEFNQPELPSIYVADRQTWMIWRAVNVKRENLTELDKFLEYHTAN